MTNDQFANKYNLEERTALFGEQIIRLCRTVKNDRLADPILNQLIRSGTSIGANYMEANGASSKRDFKNKIFICKKEAQETKHWLRNVKKFFIRAIRNNRKIMERSSRTYSDISKDFFKFEN